MLCVLRRYVHQQDWENASRVAERYEPVAIPDVYTAHAKAVAEAGDFKLAEELYLSASRPELALVMYQETNDWCGCIALRPAYCIVVIDAPPLDVLAAGATRCGWLSCTCRTESPR